MSAKQETTKPVKRDTQLTSASGYNVKRLVFSKPNKGTVPGSDPPVATNRIYINTKNPDGTIGDLILPVEELFSFGVGENTDQKTKEVVGYSMSLCLYNKDEPTKAQKEWVETFNNIVEECKKHLLKNREEIQQWDLEMSDLKKLNPLYWKRDKKTGKLVDGYGPTLYPKLIESKKKGTIVTEIYNSETDEPINPKVDASQGGLLGTYCIVNAAVKIESIFIGAKISLQVKLYEAGCRLLDNGVKRLLKPKPLERKLLKQTPVVADKSDDENNDDDVVADDSDADLQDDSDVEKEKPKVKTPKKEKKIKRKVKKVPT